jgi:hypothetical protein
MRLEIIDNEIKVELENVTVKDFRLDLVLRKSEFENQEINFNSISHLNGDKKLLEEVFQNTKKEMLENYG